MRPLLCLLLLGTCLSLPSIAQNSIFIIEAEDFDFDAGRHLSLADTMPYYGGAYEWLSAVPGIDYNRTEPLIFDGDNYRVDEYPNVPMSPAFQPAESLNRGQWDATYSFKIGWNSGEPDNWLNYTRNFPTGDYRVYAALSWGDTGPDRLRGTLSKVTAGVGTETQTTETIGTFLGDGTGGWGFNARVPLKSDGELAIVPLGPNTTVRISGVSGDYDYLMFVPAGLPEATITPSSLRVDAGSSFTLTAEPQGEGPFTYQWRLNGTDLPGETSQVLQINSATLEHQGKYTVVVTNAHGSNTSTPASVIVATPVLLDQPVSGFAEGLPDYQIFHYSFHGSAGDLIFIDDLEGDDWSLYFEMHAPGGSRVISTPLGDNFAWEPIGTYVLPETGAYQIKVTAWPWASSYFSFQISRPALIQEFQTFLGATIDWDNPAPGAGYHESFENADIYSFEILSPTALSITELYSNACQGLGDYYSGQRMAMLDPDGLLVFHRGCPPFGPTPKYQLNKTGAYKLIVVPGNLPDYYSFIIEEVPVQTHYIAIGDTISPNVPNPGAGITETSSAVDHYIFTGAAGQWILLHELNPFGLGIYCDNFNWILTSPSGQQLLNTFTENDCIPDPSERPLILLPESGPYTLTIESRNGLGDHSFQILANAGRQTFPYTLGTDIKPDRPAVGAGFLDPNGAMDVYTFTPDFTGFISVFDYNSSAPGLAWSLHLTIPNFPFTYAFHRGPVDGINEYFYVVKDRPYSFRVWAEDDFISSSGTYKLRLRRSDFPMGVTDEFTTVAGHPLLIGRARLLSNDTDADGDKLFVGELIDPPSWGGTVEEFEDDILYTPDEGFTGQDYFYYQIYDSSGMSNWGLVLITVQ